MISLCFLSAFVFLFIPQDELLARQQRDTTVRMEGVVSLSDGMPVVDASISAKGISSPNNVVAVTDKSGKYVIDGVQPGQYIVVVQKAELGASTIGSERRITVSTSNSVCKVDFVLSRPASLIGRVVGEDRTPLANIRVNAWIQATVHGQQELLYRRGVVTSADGEFRLWGLSKGTYLIRATVNRLTPTTIPKTTPERAALRAYVSTFYPSDVYASGASEIRLADGQTLEGLEVRMKKIKTNCLRGLITGAEPGSAPLSVALSESGIYQTDVIGSGEVISDTRIEFCGLAPGDYTLAVTQWNGMHMTAYGDASLGLGDKAGDVGTVDAGRLKDMTGRVSYVPEEGHGPARQDDVGISFRPMKHLKAMSEATVTRVEPDGTFQVRNLTSDQYKLAAFNLPSGTYLKAATVGNVNALLDPFPGSGTLEIVLGTDGASLSGTVVNDADSPLADTTVLVIAGSEFALADSRGMRVSRTDQNGRFRIMGLPPGDYKMLAAQNLDLDLGWRSPSQLAIGTTNVSLDPHSSKEITLKAVSLKQ